MASKIKVDNIENQCGGAVVTKCGATTTISGSVVKADDIQAADGGNLINQCGTTITLGASGDTINLASGASQSGFGRTGTVDWDTTAKTASFTAVSGNGYFVNTTSGAITLTLPASPSAGDIVAFKDYAFTFATNNLSVDGNSSPIGGVDGTNPVVYSTNGTSKTFIYVDGTKGWLVTNESTDTSQEANPTYIVATGGTITCCGDYKIHTFTGPGTFTVCSVGNPAGSDTVSYLVIAGGGEGGSSVPSNGAGGGGAGGYREGKASSDCYTASPIAATSGLPVTATGYPITVGAGGAQQPQPDNNLGNPGSNSVFSTITSAGGGGGKLDNNPAEPPTAGQGGSGGGGAASSDGNAVRRNGGSGNTPPVSPSQGNDGGTGGPNLDSTFGGGGGGGAGAVGQDVQSGTKAGNGGCGTTSSINGTATTRAGGGGAAATETPLGSGGRGLAGPGGGGIGGFSPNGDGGSGTANTGGGGGAGGFPGAGSARGGGGSGIVIIRYKYQ
jgi:hypothetical protein